MIILNRLLPIVVFWGVGCLSSDLGLADQIDFNSILKMIIIFLSIEASIIMQFRLSKGKMSIKQYIVKAILPICIVGFLSCFLNHLFGYGKTMGTLGYKKDCGILTILGIPDNKCIALLFAFYLIVLLLINIQLRMQYLNKKTTINAFAICCLSISVICMIVYYLAHIFIGALLLLSFVSLYLLKLFLLIRNL